jgi:hypothetical protein
LVTTIAASTVTEIVKRSGAEDTLAGATHQDGFGAPPRGDLDADRHRVLNSLTRRNAALIVGSS